MRKRKTQESSSGGERPRLTTYIVVGAASTSHHLHDHVAVPTGAYLSRSKVWRSISSKMSICILRLCTNLFLGKFIICLQAETRKKAEKLASTTTSLVDFFTADEGKARLEMNTSRDKKSKSMHRRRWCKIQQQCLPPPRANCCGKRKCTACWF